MKVRDAMMPDIETVGSNETIRTVAELMADLGVSTLPVSESDHLVGIVTAREIAIRIAAEALDPTRAPVRQAMSSDVLYCFENEDIEDVSQKMGAWWVRRLPVVDREKRLVGMISLAEAPSSWRALPACVNASGWVVGWDDDTRSRPLRRLSLPGRDHQSRRLAVFPLSARSTHGGGVAGCPRGTSTGDDHLKN